MDLSRRRSMQAGVAAIAAAGMGAEGLRQGGVAHAETTPTTVTDPLRQAIRNAAQTMRSAPFVIDDRVLAEGYDYLRGLVKLAVLGAWNDDPNFPRLESNDQTDAKRGMDNPDAIYLRAPLRDDGAYLITGMRGSTADLSFQVLSASDSESQFPRSLAAFDASAFKVEPDGQYRFWLMPHGRDNGVNHVRLPEGAAKLQIRDVFSDWSSERRGAVAIQRADTIGMAPSPTTVADEARRYRNAAHYLEGEMRLWIDYTTKKLSKLPVNTLPAPHSTVGGLPTQYSSLGRYRLGNNDVLIISVPRSSAPYQGIQLGSDWFISTDYVNHQTSLTTAQAHTDPDGVIRYVVSKRNPGITNWLETTGHATGYIMLRWQGTSQRLGADDGPRTKVTSFAELPNELPYYAHNKVNRHQYQRTIGARQLAVAMRRRN